MALSVEQHKLRNGFQVYTLEQRDSALVSFWLWYKVGTRNELAGATGLSHFVEHMMFKGTPTFPGSTLDKLVNESGGHWNAFTTADCTAYYTTLPPARLAALLRIESDRMLNTRFVPEEVERERQVILSERAGYENYPEYWLEEAVDAAAFTEHPYRHSVLGSASDLHSITRDQLFQHYQRYYNPAYTLAVVVGNFVTAELLTQLDDTLGRLPVSNADAYTNPAEPEQKAERIVTVHRPGPTAYLDIAYHIPAAGHPDRVALNLIDAILTGGKPPSAWSPEKEMGRSSRLYRLLVDGGLATDVRTEAHPTIDPGLFRLTITLRPEADVSQVEQLALKTVEGLASQTVDMNELLRARKQCKAQLAYAHEGVENLALLLGTFAITSQPNYLQSYAEAIKKCTADDILRVAAAYFRRDNRTIGRFIPIDENDEQQTAEDETEENDEVDAEPEASTDTALVIDEEEQVRMLQSARHVAGLTTGSSHELTSTLPGSKEIRRANIGPRVTCLACQAPGNIVTFLAAAPAGSAQDTKDLAGLSSLVNSTLLRGTQKHPGSDMHILTDALGMAVSVSCSEERAMVEVSCLAEDAAKAADLLAEIWLNPTLTDDSIEHEKGKQLANIREQEDDTRAMADRLWRETTYFEHPFALPVDGYTHTVARLTPQACREFHARHYRGGPLTLCATGAIHPEKAMDLLAKAWQNGSVEYRESGATIPAAALPQPQKRCVVLAGKSQTDITLGLPTLSYAAPDYPAFYIGHLILGRLGLYGRLGAHVRERLGLAYYVFAGLEPKSVSSPWAVRAGVDPSGVEQATAAIMHEVNTITRTPVRPTELAEAVGYVLGSLPTVLESSSDLADTLLDMEFYQLGLDYLSVFQEYIAAVNVDEVQAALAHYLVTDKFVFTSAGPA